MQQVVTNLRVELITCKKKHRDAVKAYGVLRAAFSSVE